MESLENSGRIQGEFSQNSRRIHIESINRVNELDKINTLRNRIAHHEPICFPVQGATIYTDYILNEYRKIMMLFQWMGIDGAKLLFGLDHVLQLCAKIDKLKPI